MLKLSAHFLIFMFFFLKSVEPTILPGTLKCIDMHHCNNLQSKCRTVDPYRQNLGRSSKLSFFIIYKFWQNCASVRQVFDLILELKTAVNRTWLCKVSHITFTIKGLFAGEIHKLKTLPTTHCVLAFASTLLDLTRMICSQQNWTEIPQYIHV